MGFRDWPSWLKGGVIISIIYSILFLVFSYSFILYVFTLFPGSILLPTLAPLMGECAPNLPIEGCPSDFEIRAVTFVINIVFFSIIGAIVGWIIGITKSKKQLPKINRRMVKKK